MRLLADMGISPRTVAFLRGQGHDATHLIEEGLERLPDAEILRKARNENRIILTHDLGFGELVAASRAQLPSVVTFRLKNMRPDNVNQHLSAVLARHGDDLERGAIISVTERQIRSRLLPLGD